MLFVGKKKVAMVGFIENRGEEEGQVGGALKVFIFFFLF